MLWLRRTVYLNACLGDGNGLLLHGFMNSHLVININLIKFINATNAIIWKHQGTCLNTHLSCIMISTHGDCQTGSRGGLATGVDRTRHNGVDISMKYSTLGIQYFKNWDLAVEGSPTIQILISPLNLAPSEISLCTPPISINNNPFLISSCP